MWGGSIYESMDFKTKVPQDVASLQSDAESQQELTPNRNHKKQVDFFCKQIICDWLLDLKYLGKNNRNNLMAEHHREIGIVLGPHRNRFCLIALYAAQIVPKDSKDLDEYTEISDTLQTDNIINPYIQKNWKKFATDIFDYQNQLRKDPKHIIPHLDKVMKRFKGLKLYNEEGTSFMTTKEGAKAYQDAIAFLRKQKPMAPLKWNDDLSMAA